MLFSGPHISKGEISESMGRFLTAVLLLTFGLQHTSAVAQIHTGSYSLWGEVRDGETGESLPHASVQIKGTRIGTTTNADAIKDVQIHKAGYPARYGGRVSSVVDISGKTGSMDQFHGSAGVNLLNAGTHVEVPLAGKGSFMLAARRSYTDVLKSGLYNKIYGTLSGDNNDSREPGGGAGDIRPLAELLPENGGGVQQTFQPDFHFYDVNARITYAPSQRDILTLSSYNGRDNLDRSRDQHFGSGGGGGTWIPVQPDAEQEAPDLQSVNFTDDVTRWGNLGFSGKWSRQWHPRFYSNALISHSIYESDYNHRFVNEVWDAEADTLISGDSEEFAVEMYTP